MQLRDIARRFPDDIWQVFEPLLPAKGWVGNGRPLASHQECLHALLDVLVGGIAWEMLPWCSPTYKTVQRRPKDWLRKDAFLTGWKQLAQRYQQLHGINWDQVLLDGSKKPSTKGVKRQGHIRSIAVSRVLPST
jgi:transposase